MTSAEEHRRRTVVGEARATLGEAFIALCERFGLTKHEQAFVVADLLSVLTIHAVDAERRESR